MDKLTEKQTNGYSASYAWTSSSPVFLRNGKALHPSRDKVFCAWCKKSQAEILKNKEDLNIHIENHEKIAKALGTGRMKEILAVIFNKIRG